MNQTIYFMGAGSAVKIGVAKHPDRRLRGLQTGHYEELRILRLIPEGSIEGVTEANLHYHFRDDRIRSEWFHLSPAILDYIAHPKPIPGFRPPPPLNLAAGSLGQNIQAARKAANPAHTGERPMDSPTITLGARLAELRQAAGMTQARAAQIQDVRLNSWNRWECNRQIPVIERLDAIAKMFGITVSDLWKGVELPRKGEDHAPA